MQLGAGRHAAGQLRLDVHVHILELRFPRKRAGGDLGPIASRPRMMAFSSRRGEQADPLQHGGMGHRAEDVVLPEPPVEGDGFGELGHLRRRAAGEPAAAGNW